MRSQEQKRGKLTVGEVDVFGDLVPGAVVEVANLLLVLHHVGRLASLLVPHGNVVLDRLKILPVLEGQVERRSAPKFKTKTRVLFYHGTLHRHAVTVT